MNWQLRSYIETKCQNINQFDKTESQVYSNFQRICPVYYKRQTKGEKMLSSTINLT